MNFCFTETKTKLFSESVLCKYSNKLFSDHPICLITDLLITKLTFYLFQKINNEEKAKKTPNNKNKTLPNNESIFQSESNGGGRTSMRAKKPRGKPQTV